MEADRRNCIRLVTPDERAGVFICGRQRFRARILDESARGFGIVIDAEAEFSTGQECVLESENGHSQVCVAHVQELPDGKHLGLERLSDSVGAPPKAGFSFKPALRSITHSVVALTTIVVLSIAGAILVSLLLNYHRAKVRRFAPGFTVPRASSRNTTSNKRAARPSATRSTTSKESPQRPAGGVMGKIGSTVGAVLDATQTAGSKSAKEATAAGEAAVDVANEVTALTQQRLAEWRSQLEKLPWGSPRLMAMVTDELSQLELSPEQQEMVALVISRTVAHLQAVAARIGAGVDGASIAKHLETGAIRDIVAVFTPAQREKWQQTTADSSTA